MIILASDRMILVRSDDIIKKFYNNSNSNERIVTGTIHVRFTTDLNAHARLCDIPTQELETLLNKMVDDLIPEIESLADKYYKGYSE